MTFRSKLLLLGWFTLLVFPIPTILVMKYIQGLSLLSIFQINNFKIYYVLWGLFTGSLMAALIYKITRASVFKDIPLKVEEMIYNAGLKPMDAIFISFAAAFGEEILFRSGIQNYLGVIATSILFVAIHGYFSFKNPKISLYGLLVLPFILILGFGFVFYGLWFSIAAHFSYDLTLFLVIIIRRRYESESN
jgi:membrane protease YdiL (CAAX protease family)